MLETERCGALQGAEAATVLIIQTSGGGGWHWSDFVNNTFPNMPPLHASF